nr:hypothetical protein [Tanacetum cinerariifolium]
MLKKNTNSGKLSNIMLSRSSFTLPIPKLIENGFRPATLLLPHLNEPIFTSPMFFRRRMRLFLMMMRWRRRMMIITEVEYDAEEDDKDVVEEDEEEDDDDDEVELGDDDDEDDGKDDVDVNGDDGDLFFVITNSKRNKNKLRFPPDHVAMAYVAEGWKEFQRSNDISKGDECVLKFITSEDKLCLAKVTKKKPQAMKVDNDDMDDDGMDEEGEFEDAKEDDSNVDGDDIFNDDVNDEGKGENAKLVKDDEDDEDDDCDVDGDNIFDDDVDDEGKGKNAKLVNDDEDDDDEDEDDDRDVDGNDGDPSFILTCSDKNQHHLPFSVDFVALAGINTKKTITLKNLNGYDKKLRVRSRIVQSCTKQSRRNRLKGYYLSAGWKEFQQNSNILEGDQFVFKFITSEDKFYVAKITKNITRARPLPSAVKPVIEVNYGMDDLDVEIEQDHLNHKFLTSLAPEWLISGNKEVNTAIIPTASTQVSPASANIDEDDIKEMDIKCNMALLSMRADRYWKKTVKMISIQGTDVAGFDKSKIECFNCHKMGHFARECRAPKSQDRGRRENYRQGSKEEEQAPKALMAIDEVGWD